MDPQRLLGQPVAREELVQDDLFSPDAIAASYRTTKSEISETLGLAADALVRRQRIEAVKTQMRLRELVEIVTRARAVLGSNLAAYAWFRADPLPGFGGQTASALVREGRAREVHAFLDAVAAGAYA